MDFQKGENLRKGGEVDLEKGAMTPLANYDYNTIVNTKLLVIF